MTPAIRVEGEVVGVEAGQAGTLTVQVDGTTVREVAATSGSFAVDVPASRAGMITLEYAQPGVRFVSPLGSYAGLVRMAGSDGRLTRDECECTRISAFSTGLQHVAEMMLGHPPRNDAQLREGARRAGYDLTNATVALARMAADPATLPAGYDSGLALLRDRPAFVAYLYETYYTLFDDAAAVLDGMPTAAMTASDLPERIALLGVALDTGRPAPSMAFVLEREGASYRMYAPSGSLGVSHVGTVANDAMVLVPDREIATFDPTYRCPFTYEMTGRRRQMLRSDLRRQWTSQGLEIWREVNETLVTFPDCPGEPSYLERYVSFLPAVDLADTRMLTDARRFLGRRTLPVFCSTEGQHNGLPLLECAHAVHRFEGGGSGTMLDLGNKVDVDMQPVQAEGQAPFSWSMDSDGAMHVQAGAERARYWVLDGGDGAALGVVYVAEADRASGHVSLAGYTAMIRVGATDIYNADSVPGAWGYGTLDLLSTPHLDLPPVDVRIVRQASGRSSQWHDGNWGSTERWTTAWGRLYSTRYSSPDCVAPSDTCMPMMVRYFRPLARVGDRIHGIEELYFKQASDVAPAASRPQFHERRAMPASDPAFQGPSSPAPRIPRSGSSGRP